MNSRRDALREQISKKSLSCGGAYTLTYIRRCPFAVLVEGSFIFEPGGFVYRGLLLPRLMILQGTLRIGDNKT